jgi:transposase-like protein
MNLIDVTKTFKTEDDALEFLEKMRWPDGVRCTVCGNEKVSKITRQTASKNKRTSIYQCLEKTCKAQFSATSGTIYGDSHLPLTTWFKAIALIVDAKKGMSAKQLEGHMGVTYKTAWYLCHRIRKAMEQEGAPLTGTVEIDECYVGGRVRGGRATAMQNKKVVMGAIERGGELRLRHVANDQAHTFRDFIKTNVSPAVERIHTDQHKNYPPALKALKPQFSVTHETVNHIAHEYVRGDVTTNRIESAFSLFKRGVVGSYHKVSIKHLHRYLSEFETRFNERKNPERFELLVGRACQKATMPYRQLVDENPSDDLTREMESQSEPF